MLNYQNYGLIEEFPIAGGSTFQPAWAARVSPVVGSGLYALAFLILTGAGLV